MMLVLMYVLAFSYATENINEVSEVNAEAKALEERVFLDRKKQEESSAALEMYRKRARKRAERANSGGE